MAGFTANGLTPFMIEDMKNECESFLQPLEKLFSTLNSNCAGRMFSDIMTKYIKNNRRQCTALDSFRRMKPVEFTLFLKKRQDFVHEISA